MVWPYFLLHSGNCRICHLSFCFTCRFASSLCLSLVYLRSHLFKLKSPFIFHFLAPVFLLTRFFEPNVYFHSQTFPSLFLPLPPSPINGAKEHLTFCFLGARSSHLEGSARVLEGPELPEARDESQHFNGCH